MSERTKMHHTNCQNDRGILYVTYDQKIYAIPKMIAEQYVVHEASSRRDSVPASLVFAALEKKLTRAGMLLKGLRTKEALTQKEFAKKINVTQSNLSHMENGRRPIGKNIAKRIEHIFGVDYRYFLE